MAIWATRSGRVQCVPRGISRTSRNGDSGVSSSRRSARGRGASPRCSRCRPSRVAGPAVFVVADEQGTKSVRLPADRSNRRSRTPAPGALQLQPVARAARRVGTSARFAMSPSSRSGTLRRTAAGVAAPGFGEFQRRTRPDRRSAAPALDESAGREILAVDRRRSKIAVDDWVVATCLETVRDPEALLEPAEDVCSPSYATTSPSSTRSGPAEPRPRREPPGRSVRSCRCRLEPLIAAVLRATQRSPSSFRSSSQRRRSRSDRSSVCQHQRDRLPASSPLAFELLGFRTT